MNNRKHWWRCVAPVLLSGVAVAAYAETPTMAVQTNAAAMTTAGAATATAGWRPVAIVEAGSPDASGYKGSKIAVTLPDKSKARVAVDAGGEPQALVLATSNEIADTRQRALELGAAINGDQSVTLPVTSASGAQVDFVIQADGSAVVPDTQSLPRR